MLLGLTYQLVLFVVDLVLVRTSSHAQLRAEVLAPRHQLRVMERKIGKPAWQPGDRILLAGLSRPKHGQDYGPTRLGTAGPFTS
jgi:putative transposase